MVTNASLYKYLLNQWETDLFYLANEKHNNLSDKEKLKKAKQKFLSLLFRPQNMECKFSKWLAQRFPTVMKTIWYINTGYTKVKRGNGFYKWKKGDLECPLARVLQSIEAYIILDLVCGNLLLDKPHMPLYTIHDCIVTTKKHITLVKKEIKTTYFCIFGFRPQTKTIDKWAMS